MDPELPLTNCGGIRVRHAGDVSDLDILKSPASRHFEKPCISTFFEALGGVSSVSTTTMGSRIHDQWVSLFLAVTGWHDFRTLFPPGPSA
jgi:hypothetical protein